MLLEESEERELSKFCCLFSHRYNAAYMWTLSCVI